MRLSISNKAKGGKDLPSQSPESLELGAPDDSKELGPEVM